ncbi:MAG TPA: AAA family ATPase [Nitrososphaeraceae archaeon]|jgi:magnesium chelatase subunit I
MTLVNDLVHLSYSSVPNYSELMIGVPTDYKEIRTLRDLLAINYKSPSIEQQIRGNLVSKIESGQNPYRGIIGYDDDVIPALNRALLSGHDLLLVGQIGQAKTKIAESIAKNLLSSVPIVRGSLTNDIPVTIPEDELIAMLNDTYISRSSPEFCVSKECETIVRNHKLDTRIEWIDGQSRYRYILATPDISVKDLVGQIDAIKIAKKGVEIYDIESYSAGQLLQARHGLLCLDELPVLDPRKQVALLSVLQEGKFTTGSYPIIFRPDVKVVATANPIDYTHSGKIIEPLYDRLKSHIRTHYPKHISHEMLIMSQEVKISAVRNAFLPVHIVKTMAKIAQIAREHSDIDQDRGVSVRMGIHSLELLIGEAERTRSIKYKVAAVPRFCDFHSIHQSSKFELLEIEDTYANRFRTLDLIIADAIKHVSSEYIHQIPTADIYRVKNEFTGDKTFEVSQSSVGQKKINSVGYDFQLAKFPVLREIVTKLYGIIQAEQEEFVKDAKMHEIAVNDLVLSQKVVSEFTASIIEVVLEGLRWTEPPILDKKDSSYESA